MDHFGIRVGGGETVKEDGWVKVGGCLCHVMR